MLSSKRKIFYAACAAAVAAVGVAACLALFVPRACGGGEEHSPFPLPQLPPLTNEMFAFPEFEKGDSLVRNFLKRWKLNGASLAIAKDGRLLYAKGFGYADVEQQTEVTPGHVFRIASGSKLITAAAVMKLAEEGKLSLSDRVFGSDGILNDSVFGRIYDARVLQITVKNLLEHSAGWDVSNGDDPMFMGCAIAEKLHIPVPVGVDDIIRFALSKPLSFDVGDHSSYSNLGYAILGRVVEKAAGGACEDYVQQALLLPMGIINMRLGNSYPQHLYADEVSYYDAPNAPPVAAFDNLHSLVPKCRGGYDIRMLGAAGGWVASPAALLRFVLCIDGRPEMPDILSLESVDRMVCNDSIYDPLGWRTVDERRWMRTGTLAGTSVAAVRDTSGWCWVFITNTSSKKGADFPFIVEGMMSEVLGTMESALTGNADSALEH
ncbi:MAG: beta-lactamase family protein [Prevotellaceae bacterium]|jgi:CubicO group peptidase (beta-lactamase class C family)|nr:beta-lactamase family protein [Prevotellaceae bacterium]